MLVEKLENLIANQFVNPSVRTQSAYVDFYHKEYGEVPSVRDFRNWEEASKTLPFTKEREAFLKKREIKIERLVESLNPSEMREFLGRNVPWCKPREEDVRFINKFLTLYKESEDYYEEVEFYAFKGVKLCKIRWINPYYRDWFFELE